ncbi:MAG: DUF2309 domain-containing protein [Bacteriovoracaceae bacterium]|nr:DUF2309 domain-containing protein [Bacteriovoracaceae bacterium]
MDIQKTLNDLRSYLPIQFPLGVFIHNNMLFRFEESTFHDGVKEAGQLFGAQLSLPEEYYQEKFKAKRIQEKNIRDEIQRWMKIQNLPETFSLGRMEDYVRQLMDLSLSIPIRVPEESVTEFFERAQRLRQPILPQYHRREKEWKRVFRKSLGEDVNSQFHPLFIRFISAYIDQGMSTWHNPDTHRGLIESFKSFIMSNDTFGPPWIKQVEIELEKVSAQTAESWLEKNITHLPYVAEPRMYLLDTLLELRGWAGMVNKFETEPHLMPRFAPKISVSEYLVVYLMMERATHDAILRSHSLEEMKSYYQSLESERLSASQCAYVLKALSKNYKLDHVDEKTLQLMLDVASMFHSHERGYVWQTALDLSMRDECLGTLASYRNIKHPFKPKPKAKFYFCIDDREESIRRILEESHPDYETHGVVGFFGIDMKFKSVNHPEPITQCPPVVNPSRVVEEIALSDLPKEQVANRRKWGKGLYGIWYGSRAAFRSLPFTILAGPVTSLVLLLRVFFPYFATRLHLRLKNWIVPPIKTRIRFNKEDATQGGYNVGEMATIVATILKFTGSIKDFPELNYIVAHGASSSNNPYKNAYGCGACSGKAGIPNSQIFCGMANMPNVREELRQKHNIDIPSSSYFVACYHDTSTDEILFFNRSDLPENLREMADQGVNDLREAGRHNSLERCRHFSSARDFLNEKITFKHVLDRGASLAELRPEYGHNNTAMTVIGRRDLTRGLYLDRRSFLTSYDASTDPEGVTLAGVLAGAVPVAGGIALDYYFSRIDNEVYGSGTKLPLNIASLLGVMTGSSSDLRIGLARQMVEIHEPVRNTIVVEAEPEVVERLINAHGRMKRMTHNEWIHFAIIHPVTGEMSLFKDGGFKPYKPLSLDLARTISSKIYAPHRSGPLPFAVVSEQRSVL